MFLCNCSKEVEVINSNVVKGTVSFRFKTSTKSKRGVENDTPATLIVSVINANDEVIFENKRFDLIDFNGSFLTEDIELEPGSYRLSDFNIVNNDNEVILSTPKEGSEFAELVQNPLPIEFSVTEDETTTVSPEVLVVGENDTPEDFGYVAFGFQIVDTQY